jgi:5'-3' exoribonuclease 2
MGVPAFYRWLSEKYPKCVQDVLEERVPMDAAGRPTPQAVDWRKPNPSGVECDNLYIDMNGIIHPCAHPEQGPQPTSEAQMYVNVAEAVDRLVRVNRPRQLLYLAIDGVAPRAKMNQQRARRFRSAQEARELAELEATVRVELQGDDDDHDHDHDHDKKATRVPVKPPAWDSNVITPGTTFMLRLADYIRFYVRQRLSTDPCWKHLRVLFSDASLPGEGEHKIMSHVRLQRAQPGYSPNLVHVLHGLDADLIMLGLATHEAHFYISREEVVFGRKSMEMQEQRQNESGFTDAQRLYNEAVGGEAMRHVINTQKPLQRVSLPILREYLGAEFHATLSQLPFAPSLERLLDDVVFLCFFVGNDFLPHLPSLDIRDGALDFLFNVYQQVLPTLDGYLTMPGGNLNLPAINLILEHVGAIEDYVFGLKHANEERRRDERERFKKRNKPRGPPVVTDTSQFRVQGKAAKILAKQEQEAHALKKQSANAPFVVVAPVKKQSTVANEAAAAAFKASLLGPTKVKDEEQDGSIPKDEPAEDATMDDAVSIKEDDPVKADTEDTTDNVKMEEAVSPGKRKADSVDGVGKVGDAEEEFDKDDDDNDEDEEEAAAPIIPIPVVIDPAKAKAFKENVKARQQKQLDDYASNVVDNVRLHEPGWKDRYYTDKCKAEDIEGNGGKEHLFRTYVMGLVWVMKYYYDGCPSWKFYYPFHYGALVPPEPIGCVYQGLYHVVCV